MQITDHIAHCKAFLLECIKAIFNEVLFYILLKMGFLIVPLQKPHFSLKMRNQYKLNSLLKIRKNDLDTLEAVFAPEISLATWYGNSDDLT